MNFIFRGKKDNIPGKGLRTSGPPSIVQLPQVCNLSILR